jgi:hypothetical protein
MFVGSPCYLLKFGSLVGGVLLEVRIADRRRLLAAPSIGGLELWISMALVVVGIPVTSPNTWVQLQGHAIANFMIER